MWDVKKFPYLWYWQERFSPGFPFYGRAEITGLEPASCYPDEALNGASKSGRSTIIPVGETLDRIDFAWTANLKPLDSVVMGEAGNAQNALSVTPWPSDHRAVLTTVEVDPIPTPALITVEPRPVRAGDSFVIRVASPDGGNYTANVVKRGETTPLIGIADVAPDDRPTIRLSTLGLPQGDYDAVMLDATGLEIARTRFAIVPPDGHAEMAVTAPVTRIGKTAGSKYLRHFSQPERFKFWTA
jgi:hypothetical protein